MLLKILCVIAVILFGVFTFWQFNDLPQYGTESWLVWIWVIFYALAAGVALVALFKHLPVWVYVVGAVGALAAAIHRSTSIEWSGQVFYNETNPAGNETGGLLMVAIWFAYLASAAYRAERAAV